MKKILAILLATAMMLALLPATVLAETQSGTWGGIDWSLTDDGTLTIAPTTGTPVPDAKCGKTYEVGAWREAVIYDSTGNGVDIGGWPFDRTKVTKLVIKEGVTSIGSFTAQGFTNLTGEVIIPSTVTYIGQEAFQKSTFTTLTFAEGGTEELCIAQGAFKNLIIETVALPADRPVHLHAWVFNNCHELKSATLPATVTKVWGTNHIDYFKNFEEHSNPTWTKSSEIFAYDEKLETITFGSETVRDMFFANNNGTNRDYVVAYSGVIAYADLQEALDAAAEGDGEVVILKNITLAAGETLTIPAEVTLTIPSGKTLTNKGTIYVVSSGKFDGTLTNVDDGTVIYVYEVTFLADGETIATVYVPSGDDAELPDIPEKAGHSAAWDHDGKNITADTVITVIYTPDPTAVPEVTDTPTEAPIEAPTEAPTEAPADDPTSAPTEAPTVPPSNPVTGDNSRIFMAMIAMLVSLCVVIVVSKRQRSNEN